MGKIITKVRAQQKVAEANAADRLARHEDAFRTALKIRNLFGRSMMRSFVGALDHNTMVFVRQRLEHLRVYV